MARLIPISEAAKAFSDSIDVSPATGLVLGRQAQGPGALLAPPTWAQVSSRHLQLQKQEGCWGVKDLSRNGTIIDGERLQKGHTRVLLGGEVIKVSVPIKGTDALLVEWRFELAPTIEGASPAKKAATGDVGGKRQAEATPPAAKRGKATAARTPDASLKALEQNAKLRKQLQEQHETHLTELAAAKQKATEERNRLLHQLSEKEEGLKRSAAKELEAEVAEVKAKNSHLTEQLQASVARAQEVAEELEASRKEEASLQAELSASKQAADEAEARLQKEISEQAARHALELETLKRSHADITSAKAEVEAQICNSTTALTAERAAHSELKASSTAALTSLKEELTEAQGVLEEAEAEATAARGRERCLRNDLEAAHCALRDMQESLERLQDHESMAWQLEAEEEAALQKARQKRCSNAEEAAEELQMLGKKVALALHGPEEGNERALEATQASSRGRAVRDEPTTTGKAIGGEAGEDVEMTPVLTASAGKAEGAGAVESPPRPESAALDSAAVIPDSVAPEARHSTDDKVEEEEEDGAVHQDPIVEDSSLSGKALAVSKENLELTKESSPAGKVSEYSSPPSKSLLSPANKRVRNLAKRLSQATS